VLAFSTGDNLSPLHFPPFQAFLSGYSNIFLLFDNQLVQLKPQQYQLLKKVIFAFFHQKAF